jgi:hypothetical protein
MRTRRHPRAAAPGFGVLGWGVFELCERNPKRIKRWPCHVPPTHGTTCTNQPALAARLKAKLGRGVAASRRRARRRHAGLCRGVRARLEAAAPLTDADRAELAGRRAEAAYRAEVSARQRAANDVAGW